MSGISLAWDFGRRNLGMISLQIILQKQYVWGHIYLVAFPLPLFGAALLLTRVRQKKWLGLSLVY